MYEFHHIEKEKKLLVYSSLMIRIDLEAFALILIITQQNQA